MTIDTPGIQGSTVWGIKKSRVTVDACKLRESYHNYRHIIRPTSLTVAVVNVYTHRHELDISSSDLCWTCDLSTMSSSTILQAPSLVLKPIFDTFLSLPTYVQVLSVVFGFPAIAITLNVLSQVS